MPACDCTPRQALAWMAQRENSNALPPFWEPRFAPGSTTQLVYTNQASAAMARTS